MKSHLLDFTGPRHAGRNASQAELVKHRRPTLAWQLLRLLIASSRDHAFLDHRWIPWLLALTPTRYQRPLALRLLSLSPHYWIYQWTNRYPKDCQRSAILQQEYERNVRSRQELCDKLLTPFLRPEMSVLDFGCGPGFLAKAVSAHVKHVLATDVSRGVIGCANILNPADNLNYVRNQVAGLQNIPDKSVDLVYSFAVFQHLLKAQTALFFKEFARILKPGGLGLCHTVLDDADAKSSDEPDAKSWIARRVQLRMVHFSVAEISKLLAEAGFNQVTVNPIATISAIADDIGQQHLIQFSF